MTDPKNIDVLEEKAYKDSLRFRFLATTQAKGQGRTMGDQTPPQVEAQEVTFPDLKGRGSYELLITSDDFARIGQVELAAHILTCCREIGERGEWATISPADLLRRSGKEGPEGWHELTCRLIQLAEAGLVTARASEGVRVTIRFIIAVRNALYDAN